MVRDIRSVALLAAALLSASPVWALARIVEPVADAVVHSDGGQVHVVVEGVSGGDQVVPLLDGKSLHIRYASPEFDLYDVPRGAHELVVAVLGPRDDYLTQTAPVRFTVWHASRLQGANR